MRQIAVFGGSFSPIHKGHLAIAKAVLDWHLAEEVWLMVSPRNPLKEERALLPEALRLKLARLATEDEKGITASDYEFHLPRPSYTFCTLAAMEEDFPLCRFSLLVGGDNWRVFSRWYRYDDILRRYPLIVYPRQDEATPLPPLPPGAKMLPAPLLDISSTRIRDLWQKGEDVSRFVPQKAYEYLEKEWPRTRPLAEE